MTTKLWTIMRWSGREGEAPRKVFTGTLADAVIKFTALRKRLSKGSLELLDDQGQRLERTWPRRKLRLVSKSSVPAANHLIALIAEGEHSKEQIVEACRLWLKLQADKSK